MKSAMSFVFVLGTRARRCCPICGSWGTGPDGDRGPPVLNQVMNCDEQKASFVNKTYPVQIT